MSQQAGPGGHRGSSSLEDGIETLRWSQAFRGSVEIPGGHDHANDHLALIYESREEQFDAAIPFLRQGLERNERCVYVVDENTEAEVLAAMRARGIDVDNALATGALLVLTPADTYRRTGEFDADAVFDFWETALEEATDEEGYSGIRAAAEMTWALNGGTSPDQLVEYEALLNPLYEGEAYVVLCQYNRDRFSAKVVHDVIRTHPYLVHDGAVYPNVYYTPPEEFLGPSRYECEVERMLGTLRAQTEAKTQLMDRERQLEKSERRYRTLVENFPDGAVTLFDEDLRYLTVGGENIERLGLTVEEIEGSRLQAILPDDLVEQVAPHYQAAIEGGERHTFEVEYGGRHYQFYALPVRNEEGEIFVGMGMSHDITDRKAYEQELRDAKSQLEAATEAGAVGTWEWHVPEDEMVTGEGFARLFGVDPDAAREGTSLDQFISAIHEADRERVERRVEEAVETCGEYEAEYRVWTDDDELRWVIARGHVQCDEDGNPVTFPGALTDITERKQIEQEREELIDRLESSNDQLEQFAYAASHDLQEPLRMVSTYLQLIEDRYGDALSGDGQEFIDFAVDGADRMREMIQSLLEFSRIRTEESPLEPVELNEVVDNTLADLTLRIEESGAEVAAGGLPSVEGDAGQLRQLFQNLLENAIEYSGDEPAQVEISAKQDGMKWVIAVRDEGIGIPPDEQDRVFEVFKRLHTQEEHPGTGVGLALCKQIVTRHGGDIWIESEPGDGTTVFVTLPAERSDAI